MKLRITDNSIRIRLSIEELDLLSQGEAQSINLDLINGELYMVLRPVRGDAFSAIDEGELLLEIPRDKFIQLKESDEEGFHLNLAKSTLLIEKDFKCIGRDEESNAGLFENPKEKDGAC